MKRWWWALLVVVVFTAIAGSAAWLAHPWLQREVSRRLEEELAKATGLPASITGFEIGLFPPRAAFSRLVLGSVDAPALEVADVTADIDPFIWAADVRVGSLKADTTRWPEASPVESPSGGVSLPTWVPAISASLGAVAIDTRVAEAPLHVGAQEPTLRLTRRLAGVGIGIDGGIVAVERGGETFRFKRLATEAEVEPGSVVLRSVDVDGDIGSIVAGARPDRGSSAAPLQVHLTLDLLARLLGISEPVTGDLRWAGEVRLPSSLPVSLAAVSATGKLDIDAPLYGEYRARHLSADLALQDQKLQIRALDVSLEHGSIAGSVDLSLSPPHAIRLELAARAEDLEALVPAVKDVLASGPGDLRIDAAGDLSPLSIAGSLNGRIADLRRIEPTPAKPSAPAPKGLDAVLAVDFRQVEKGTEADGTIRLVAPAEATAAGAVKLDVRLAGSGALSGTVELRVAEAKQLRPLAPAVSAGKIDGQLTLGGSLEAPSAEGSVVADGLVLAGTRFERIGGNFGITADAFTARPLEMRAVGGAAKLEGQIGLTAKSSNDWHLVMQHVDLGAVWIALDSGGVSLPYMTGTLDGEAAAKGTWEQVDLSARLVTAAVSVGTERFSGASMKIESKSQKWTLDAEVLRRPEEALRIAGAGTGLGSMWISAWSTPWQIAGFRFLNDLPARHGEAVFNADLYGSPAAPLGKAQLTVSDLAIGQRQLGTFSAAVDALPNGLFQLFLGEAEERLRVEGSVRGESGRPFTLGAELRDFDLAHILAPQQPTTLFSDGSARFEGRLSDAKGSLRGELTLSRFEIGREALKMQSVQPVVIRARGGQVQVESFDLQGDFGTIAVRGSVGLNGEVALDVRADADARVTEAIPKSPVRWASGSASIDAHIRRPAGGAPQLEGHGSVQQLSVDIGLPFLMTDTNGGFVLDGSRITLEPLRGRAGGGTFVLGGYIDLAEGPRLTWQVDGVNSGFLDWLEDEVTGTGEIRGTWDEIVIAGDIRVESALYARDVELVDLLPIFRRNLGHAPRKPGEKAIGLDLHIVAPDAIYIDNNVAKAEFRADLNIGGTDLETRIGGEVELLDGQATIFDRRFEVTLGRVNFDGSAKVNPRLEFSANTDISTSEGDYNIVAELTGSLDDPRVRLSADDRALTTNDVATLLTVGKTMTQIEREGGGASMGDLVNLAPVLYGSSVQKGVKQFLPVERFSIEPGFSRTTGDFEPRITVGVDLARHLRGTLATTVGVQTQNSVQLEYQLTPRTVIVGSWDSRTETTAGGFGGGIKFRYRFRYLPRFSLLPPEWRSRQ